MGSALAFIQSSYLADPDGFIKSTYLSKWGDSWESQERDERGRWGSGDGGLDAKTVEMNGVASIVQNPVSYLSSGHDAYIAANGIPSQAGVDYSKVQVDPAKLTAIAQVYDAAPNTDPAAIASYAALGSEVDKQYDYLTNTLGVTVDVVTTDPYSNVTELAKDLSDNHHISVLSTAVTGGHPYFSNQTNDEFRAVHDAFGHAASGRGFDRNGEEAAYQSHERMFSEAARSALAAETRGQNSSLITDGKFPPQKLVKMPDWATKERRLITADDDNNYDPIHQPIHHTSCGRSFGPPPISKAIDLFIRKSWGDAWESEPRDADGRWGTGDGDSAHSDAAIEAAATGIEESPWHGGTFDPQTASSPTTGFQVAITGHTAQFPEDIVNDHAALTAALHGFVQQNDSVFKENSNMYIGAWTDSGKLWLEPSENIQDREQAVALGTDRDQIAIWDNVKGEEISTGGSGGTEKAVYFQASTGLLGHDRGSAKGMGSDYGYPTTAGTRNRWKRLDRLVKAWFGKADKSEWANHPSHKYHDAIVAYWVPIGEKVLRDSVKGLRPAVHDAIVEARKLRKGMAKSSWSDIAQASMGHVDIEPSKIDEWLSSMMGDSYLAGEHVGARQLEEGPVRLEHALAGASTEINWDNWKPGWGGAGGILQHGGYEAMLSDAFARINGMTGEAMNRMGETLTDGLQQGNSPQDIAQQIAVNEATDQLVEAIVNQWAARSLLIANTEVARAMTQATLSTYDMNGVTSWSWLSEDDDDTCKVCGDLNGKDFDTAHDPDAPPAHPNCRCCVLPNKIAGQDFTQPQLDLEADTESEDADIAADDSDSHPPATKSIDNFIRKSYVSIDDFIRETYDPRHGFG